MTTLDQEISQEPEQEVLESDDKSQDSSDVTKELYRRESPIQCEIYAPEIPKLPSLITENKTHTKNTPLKKEDTSKHKPNSGIPRLKSKTNTMKNANKATYRSHNASSSLGPVVNKNTLEMQFINNKKRLLQLHTELVEKQRPLVDMHKSLLRTKKQLEDMGKKVVLEDLKVMSLKGEDVKNQDGSGESPTAQTALNLRSSIENALEACSRMCKKCLIKRDNIVQFLENAAKSNSLSPEFEVQVEELVNKEKDALEQTVENVIKENEKKVEDLITKWEKSIQMRNLSEEMTTKITNLEDTIKQQQKSILDAEDNLHSLTRKYEDKRVYHEKIIGEFQEKINKMDDELKKEKKNANDNLMKSRNLRTKVIEMETKVKDAEDKCNDASNKLRQLQEQMKKKEVQWMKEKNDFKKNEELLQQKFSERQSQFDTRIKDIEIIQKNADMQQQNFYRTLQTQLEIKDQETVLLQEDKEALSEKTQNLEDQLNQMKKLLAEKENEIKEMNDKIEAIPAIEYAPNENQRKEMLEYKKKIIEVEDILHQQGEQMEKMQNSLKAHAKLAAALKMEKDSAIKYSNKLRDILQEARDEIQYKNKTIYKIHEKLVLKERACDSLRSELKEYEANCDHSRDRWNKNRCQICMTTLSADHETPCSSYVEDEVGKSHASSPRYVSESLIGMSVKKVDHLRARLDSLKKMKIPNSSIECSWSQQQLGSNIRKQIELKGKLYQILQKHADQSCEDFINLLKLTVSNVGTGSQHQELKPSNDKAEYDAPQKLTPKIKLTDSFSTLAHYLGAIPRGKFYERLNETLFSENDDLPL